MQTYSIIDISNLVQRIKHGIKSGNYESYEDLVGLMMHITLYSIKKSFHKFKCSHVVACFDGGDYWRKDILETYKVKEKDMSPEALEKDAAASHVISELYSFFKDGSDVTVLKKHRMEADDFIARWTQYHVDPEKYQNIIVSRDTDFIQLLRDNVKLYDPQDNILHTVDGVFYQDHTRAKDRVEMYGEMWRPKKDKSGEDIVVDPEWSLFEKIIRGDYQSDKIPSAYPRVRTKVMKEAYEDRGGLLWNNLINSSFGKAPNIKQVRPLYDRNEILIDLSKQPSEIKTAMDEVILEQLNRSKQSLIGIQFGKLCGRNELYKILKDPTPFVKIFNLEYGN